MHIIKEEGVAVDRDLLKFRPTRKVQGIGNTFYFQTLNYGDDGLYLQVPFFHSNGMSSSSYSNLRQMRVSFPKWKQTILKMIDSFAKECVELPDSAPVHWKKKLEEGSGFKDLPEFDTLFLKLSDHFQAFDVLSNPMDCDDLKRGRYMGLVHVTGLYIGAHGSTGKLASLQMKVLQLVYEPLPIDKCLIHIEDIATPSEPKESNDAKEAKEVDESKKRTRRSRDSMKLKLRRQDAQTDLKSSFDSTLDEDTQMW